MKVSAEDLKHIDSAVASVAERLNPEDRHELRQELAVKLLRRQIAPKDVRNWLRSAALGWAINFQRNEEKQRELLRELHVRGVASGYKKGPSWEPKWYPPHPDAIEHAWLACEGARFMHVKPAKRTRYVEDAIAEVVDNKRKSNSSDSCP